MKFYKRYPGDITIKTGHLDPSEFGCYDRLLDHYYATERPIPADGAYSICRAVKPEHRRACDKVLSEFFTLTDRGWIQQRAEEVIAEALPALEAARANGKRGGRPKKVIRQASDPHQNETESKPSGFSTETEAATKPETQSADLGKAIQIPDSSLTTFEKRARKRAVPESVPADLLVESGFDGQTASEFIAHKAGKKAPLTPRAWQDHCREAAKAGLSPQAAAEKVMAKGWKGFEASYVAKPAERRTPAERVAEPEWRREQRERNQAFLGPAAKRSATIIDLEDANGDARLVG